MFNLSKIGRPIAVIEGGKNDKKIISMTEDGDKDVEDVKTFKSIHVTDGKLQQLPNTKKERDILYICGASGSGKSYYTGQYLKRYKKAYPQNEIYLISSVKEDSALDKLVKRIKTGENITELEVEDFKDSCVVFDDIDVLKDKEVRTAIYSLLDLMLETGRHHKITVIMTNHLATNGKDTRRILNEASSITVFPQGTAGRGLKYLLSEYLGLDKKQITALKNANSRWVTIFKCYPMLGMTEHDLVPLSQIE
jgi:predicted kinase